MEKYNVLLIEDRVTYRAYFESIFKTSGRYSIVMAEENGEDAVEKYSDEKTDIILCEAADKNGRANFDAAGILKEKTSAKLIMIIHTAEYTYPQRAKLCGADSLWYTEDKSISLPEVIQKTILGEKIWPEKNIDVEIGHAKGSNFTEKEMLVLRYVVLGYSNREISEKVNMSYYTVRDYVKQMLEKTHLQSRTALAAEAVGRGLVAIEKCD